MKHIIKKLLALALTALMLTTLALPAAADAIWEPNDSFYKTHADACEYVRHRRYLTNSDAGYVYGYQSPESGVTTAALPNGTEISVAWLYTDKQGESWGLPSSESGWFKLSELSLIYDCQAFLADHASELTPFSSEGVEAIEGSSEKFIYGWTYPGGEKYIDIRLGNVVEFVSQTYTDADGLVWGYILYMYGARDFWVCLSAPYDESVGGTAVEQHAITLRHEPVPAEDIPVSQGNVMVWIIVGVLIVAVVGGTAVLIRVVYAKKKK